MGLFREYMTYSTEPSSVVAAELPGWMRVGLTKSFDSGSTIRHGHDGEFQPKCRHLQREKQGSGDPAFPTDDDVQRNEMC
jgi:hypothetical protein